MVATTVVFVGLMSSELCRKLSSPTGTWGPQKFQQGWFRPVVLKLSLSRGPLLSLIGENLIYRDTWAVQYHGKAT